MASTTFPVKLHRLLCEAERGNHNDVISWLPDGESFKVHDKTRFTSEFMPSYFGTSNYRSFQKNLNMWGFITVRGGDRRGTCSHPLFIRDLFYLCHRMVRHRAFMSKPKDKKAADCSTKPRASSPPECPPSPTPHSVAGSTQCPSSTATPSCCEEDDASSLMDESNTGSMDVSNPGINAGQPPSSGPAKQEGVPSVRPKSLVPGMSQQHLTSSRLLLPITSMVGASATTREAMKKNFDTPSMTQALAAYTTAKVGKDRRESAIHAALRLATSGSVNAAVYQDIKRRRRELLTNMVLPSPPRSSLSDLGHTKINELAVPSFKTLGAQLLDDRSSISHHHQQLRNSTQSTTPWCFPPSCPTERAGSPESMGSSTTNTKTLPFLYHDQAMLLEASQRKETMELKAALQVQQEWKKARLQIQAKAMSGVLGSLMADLHARP